MDEVGIGLFGYGFIAGAHVHALRRAGARIVAVCGPHRARAQAFAQRHAIAHVYTTPADMLARPDIAAVVVASPDAAHAALTMAAAQAGKHVFCEKPVATALHEARAMVAVVQARGLVGMTGFLLRGAPVVQRMAATIRHGEAGTLISLHVQRSNATLLGPEATHTWRTDAQQSGLGVLGDLGSHMIDLALLLGGPLSEVSADLLTVVRELPDAATGRPVPQRLDDDVTLALRFARGGHGTISLSRVSLAEAHLPLGRSQIVLNGTKLAITSDGIAHATVHRLGHPPEEWPLDARVAGLDHGALLAYLGEEVMQAFLAAIRSGVPAPPTLEDGLAVTDLLFRPLYAFFLIELASRRVLHVGVTRHPTDAWVAQQLREATPFGQHPRFLIRDNDSKYGAAFSRVAASSGIEEVHTAYRAPQENAICERFLGSVRRECLDHLLILSERHLRRILQHYVAYFNADRPHQGLQQRVPVAKEGLNATDGHGVIQRMPVLGACTIAIDVSHRRSDLLFGQDRRSGDYT